MEGALLVLKSYLTPVISWKWDLARRPSSPGRSMYMSTLTVFPFLFHYIIIPTVKVGFMCWDVSVSIAVFIIIMIAIMFLWMILGPMDFIMPSVPDFKSPIIR